MFQVRNVLNESVHRLSRISFTFTIHCYDGHYIHKLDPDQLYQLCQSQSILFAISMAGEQPGKRYLLFCWFLA